MLRKLSVSLFLSAGMLVAVSSMTKEAAAADVTVSASVVAACTITGADISFGAYVIGQTDPSDAQDNISYDCGAGRNITLELDFGGNPNGTTHRNMIGATNQQLLSYNLYQDTGRNIVWGEGAAGLDVTNTAAGVIDVPVFGRIDGGAGAPADTYSDTVTFNLTING